MAKGSVITHAFIEALGLGLSSYVLTKPLKNILHPELQEPMFAIDIDEYPETVYLDRLNTVSIINSLFPRAMGLAINYYCGCVARCGIATMIRKIQRLPCSWRLTVSFTISQMSFSVFVYSSVLNGF